MAGPEGSCLVPRGGGAFLTFLLLSISFAEPEPGKGAGLCHIQLPAGPQLVPLALSPFNNNNDRISKLFR